PLAERARVALRRAGDRALSLNAFEAAVRFYASALELTSSEDPDRPRLLLASGEAQWMAGGVPEGILSEAIRLLVEAGDSEHAARGELMLGDIEWRRGQRDLAYAHVDRAVGLLKNSPPSSTKARVLSEVSRYHMLGGRVEEAIDIGWEAHSMSEQLGIREVQAHALDNIGTARAYRGDLGGIDDLRRSIEIASGAHSVEELRARNNLGAVLIAAGDFRGGVEAWTPGIELAEHFRGVPNAEWILTERMPIAYGEGRWDDLERLMDEFLAELGPTHYQAGFVHEIRSRVRVARQDLAGALADADTALARGRLAKDPQRLLPALANSAFTLLHAGRVEACSSRVNELMSLDPFRTSVSHSNSPVLDLAWILTALGRGEECLEGAAGVEDLTRWHRAGVAFVRGDVERAVEICTEIGVLPNEAYMRLRAAAKLLEDGRAETAEAQIEKALGFYRSVGAHAYIREAEALMAASA
ncbi:MAG: hypothetical protein ACRDHO_00590, partial [Actinomycetota bacterium]